MSTAFVQESPRRANTYASDDLFKTYLEWKLGPDLLAAMERALLELGELAAGALFELQRADRITPADGSLRSTIAPRGRPAHAASQ